MLCAKIEVLGLDGFAKKDSGVIVKILSGISSIERSLPVLTAKGLDLWVAGQVIDEPFRYNFALRQQLDPYRQVLGDFFLQQWIMRTGKQQHIDCLSLFEYALKILLYEEIRTMTLMLI